MKKYEEDEGRRPLDVSQQRKYIGFDVMSVDPRPDGTDHRTIEVKSTRGKGIPDAFDTEFTRGLKFVATHLYLVRFAKRGNEPISLRIVPKAEIDKFSDEHRLGYRITFAQRLQRKVEGTEFKEWPLP